MSHQISLFPDSIFPGVIYTDYVDLFIYLTPRSSQKKIQKMVLKDDRWHLHAYVHSPPIAGQANLELIEVLSNTFTIPRSAFSIIKGVSSRLKTLRVHSQNPQYLLKIKDICRKISR